MHGENRIEVSWQVNVSKMLVFDAERISMEYILP